jgi:hypothetical protein
VKHCSGAPGLVGTTPIHLELGCEKAKGITELDGLLSGIVVLVPESFIGKSEFLKHKDLKKKN